jgi:hypothetical protein
MKTVKMQTITMDPMLRLVSAILRAAIKEKKGGVLLALSGGRLIVKYGNDRAVRGTLPKRWWRRLSLGVCLLTTLARIQTRGHNIFKTTQRESRSWELHFVRWSARRLEESLTVIVIALNTLLQQGF